MKVKVGIVETGAVTADAHLPFFKSLKNVEVVAICDQKESIETQLSQILASRKHTQILRPYAGRLMVN
jgi:predicted dehydrogenase